MAIDTREKRMSIMTFGDSALQTLFEADSAVDNDDRYHILGLYSGIALDGIPEVELDTLPVIGMFAGNPP